MLKRYVYTHISAFYNNYRPASSHKIYPVRHHHAGGSAGDNGMIFKSF